MKLEISKILILFILAKNLGAASSSVISSQLNWDAGFNEGTQATESYGNLRLSPVSVNCDEFDQDFLKAMWTKDQFSSISTPGNKIVIEANGNSNVGGSGIGIRSLFVPIETNGTFCVTVNPEINKSGGIYISGSPWATNYFSIYFYKDAIYPVIKTHWLNGITGSSQTFSVIGSEANLCISKNGSNISASFFDSVQNETFTAITINLGEVNYSVGLGMPFPTGISNNRADYSNFQVRPYVSEGTWTSAPIDLGGVPSVPAQIAWDGETPAGSSISLQTASSGDGLTWSAWSLASSSRSNQAVSSPSQRYLKVKVTMKPSSDLQTSPTLHSISIEQTDFVGELLPLAKAKAVPNPTKGGVIHFEYLLADSAKAAKVYLSGPNGEILEEIEAGASLGVNQVDIDSSKLAQGVYFVRVLVTDKNGSEHSVVKKVVVLK